MELAALGLNLLTREVWTDKYLYHLNYVASNVYEISYEYESYKNLSKSSIAHTFKHKLCFRSLITFTKIVSRQNESFFP